MLVYVCVHILLFFSIYWSDTSLVNELLTRELEALSLAYTLPEQNYKSLIMVKMHDVSE